MGKGMNMFGIFQRDDNERIKHHPSGVEKIDALPRKRRKRSFDFLLTPVEKGDMPWDF